MVFIGDVSRKDPVYWVVIAIFIVGWFIKESIKSKRS